MRKMRKFLNILFLCTLALGLSSCEPDDGGDFRISSEKRTNSSELSFHSSEVSFHSSEVSFRLSVENFHLLPGAFGFPTEERESRGDSASGTRATSSTSDPSQPPIANSQPLRKCGAPQKCVPLCRLALLYVAYRYYEA